MIVVDSSVFIAVLEQEPDAERFLSIIRDATRRLASAVTVYETGIVIGARRGRQSAEEIMTFLAELGVEIVIRRCLDGWSGGLRLRLTNQSTLRALTCRFGTHVLWPGCIGTSA